MAFQEGHKKVGGREKGSCNKLTRDLRDALKAVVSKELEGLEARIEKMGEIERIELLLKLLPYILPKVDKVHFTEGESVWDNFV